MGQGGTSFMITSVIVSVVCVRVLYIYKTPTRFAQKTLIFRRLNSITFIFASCTHIRYIADCQCVMWYYLKLLFRCGVSVSVFVGSLPHLLSSLIIRQLHSPTRARAFHVLCTFTANLLHIRYLHNIYSVLQRCYIPTSYTETRINTGLFKPIHIFMNQVTNNHYN